jgi:hypothetical protein
MAVSDILFDASEGIREYLQTNPRMYDEVQPRLNKLLSEMDALRTELDTPPIANHDR